MIKRIFTVVLDSFGIGAMPDADRYGDQGSDTLGALTKSAALRVPNLLSMGLGAIEGSALSSSAQPRGAYGRLLERSAGKDTTTGHWELAGVVTERPFPTYPEGFPRPLIDRLELALGVRLLCNRPYSGTQVIRDYGSEHLATGALICYTSADSVLQLAAHEDLVPVETLYRYCKIAREVMTGDDAVGRIIARPFAGEAPDFYRTERRHDFSLKPPTTLLDLLQQAGKDVLSVGKIYDIFAGQGISQSFPTANNAEGIATLSRLIDTPFEGLCFVNLVDFDMLYGHRNDVDGYAKAISDFDRALGDILPRLKDDDLLIVTADHGCDPSTPSTDHSREYVPLLICGTPVRQGVNLGTRATFADVAATVADCFDCPYPLAGTSFKQEILR